MLEALADYHRKDRYGFSPPGHRQGRGADQLVRDVLGDDPFRADVLARGGLDDWAGSPRAGTPTEISAIRRRPNG